jgi:hypothetical protein
MALFHNFGLNHADGVTECGQVGGIACVAHNNAPPRYAADLSRL